MRPVVIQRGMSAAMSGASCMSSGRQNEVYSSAGPVERWLAGAAGSVDTLSYRHYRPDMAGRKTMTVSLTPELEAFVASHVSSGRFVSASEVVREGLRLLEEREVRRETELARLRREVQVGLEQARAGELVDGEEVFADLERRTAEPNRAG